MSTIRIHRRARPAALVLATLVLGTAAMTACGDDDTPDAVGPATTAPTTTSAGGDDVDEAPDAAVTVRLVDFAFQDLPDEVSAGTKLTVRNESTAELHELVAFRLPDDVTDPVGDLLARPEAELGPLLGAPVTVLLQAPGSDEVIPAVGDGTLTEPGRYVLICSIPTGADPGEYLAAAAASGGAPPEGVAGGPPHLVNGMFGELTVRP